LLDFDFRPQRLLAVDDGIAASCYNASASPAHSGTILADPG
jgi:hypothetical protein